MEAHHFLASLVSVPALTSSGLSAAQPQALEVRARHPSYCDNSTTPKPRPPHAPAHLFIKLITPPLFQVPHPASPSEPRKKHPTGKASAYPLHPRDFVHRASLECAKHARNVEAADRGCGCRKSSPVNRFSDEKTEEKPWLTSHFLLLHRS